MGLARGLASYIGFSEEIVKRGLFAVNAIRRIAQAEDKRKQFTVEQRHFLAHQQASIDRRKVDAMMDAAAEVYGPKMGWYLGPNENHCVICKGAAGKNFDVRKKPSIGFPGSAHPNCHCSPGAAFPGSLTLP